MIYSKMENKATSCLVLSENLLLIIVSVGSLAISKAFCLGGTKHATRRYRITHKPNSNS